MSTQNKFVVLDSVCVPGHEQNDDLIGTSQRCIWILDGATGITDKRLLPGPSDAMWFVQSINRALTEYLENNLPTADILSQVIDAVKKEFIKTVKQEEAHEIEHPSASFAMARIKDFCIELVNLGDCKIIYKKKDNTVQAFGSSKVKNLDQLVVAEMVRMKKEGYRKYEDIWIELKKIIRSNRELKNTENGYWILDLTNTAIPYLQTETLPISEIDQLLLVSDGLYRLVDTYFLYDERTLINTAASTGLNFLLTELRQIEKDDLDCDIYPRIKVRDDSSGLLVSLG